MDWELILLIIVTIALLVAGGYIKRLVKEIREFIDVTHKALADQKISSKELASIIKEAGDIGEVIKEIIKRVGR